VSADRADKSFFFFVSFIKEKPPMDITLEDKILESFILSYFPSTITGYLR
jgi:hypothetical protein